MAKSMEAAAATVSPRAGGLVTIAVQTSVTDLSATDGGLQRKRTKNKGQRGQLRNI
jgi:hypothetical protein